MKKAYIHDKYDKRTLYYDVALVLLEKVYFSMTSVQLSSRMADQMTLLRQILIPRTNHNVADIHATLQLNQREMKFATNIQGAQKNALKLLESVKS